MLGQIDVSHAPGADPPAQTVLAKLPRLDDLLTQPRDRLSPERGDRGQEEQKDRIHAEESQGDHSLIATFEHPSQVVGIQHANPQDGREWNHRQNSPRQSLPGASSWGRKSHK